MTSIESASDPSGLSANGLVNPTPNVIAAICIIAVILALPIFLYSFIMCRWACDKELENELKGIPEPSKNPEEEVSNLPDIPPVLLSFRQVSYSVPDVEDPSKQKFLLQNVSGWFAPSTLTAILGSSGCGKTTLLTVLADQDDAGTKSGQIYVNGHERETNFRRLAAYVMQNDQLMESLTVREALWFACELRLGIQVKKHEKFHIIHQTLQELDLFQQADVPTFRLSGGQKRRVTVALELVARPSLIFLDEPTSGLDAGGALKLCQVLRNLANGNRTVICTIHQPRSDAFNLFDQCLLLNLGQVVYFGKVTGILQHFAPELIVNDEDEKEPVNPADLVLDLTHDMKLYEGEVNAAAEEEKLVKPLSQNELLELYGGSELKKDSERILYRIHHDGLGLNAETSLPPRVLNVGNDKYASSTLKQAFTLTRRAFVNDMRNPAYLMQWVLGIVMMLFMGMLYCYVDTPTTVGNVTDLEINLAQWGACTQNLSTLALVLNTTIAGVNQTILSCGQQADTTSILEFARTSLLYQLLAASFFSEMPQVAAVHADRALLFREHASRSYSSGAWILSWVSRLAFAGFVKGIVFPPFVYFSAQLPRYAEPYFLFCIFLGTMSVAGGSMALLVGAATPSFETATVGFVVINVIAQNLCGYFIGQYYIGWWFRWIYYTNFFRYTFDGIIYSQLLTPSFYGTVGAELYNNYRFLAWQYAIIALCLVFAMQLGAFLVTWNVASRVGDAANLCTCRRWRGRNRAGSTTSQPSWTLDPSPQFVHPPKKSSRSVLAGLAAASAIQGAHVT